MNRKSLEEKDNFCQLEQTNIFGMVILSLEIFCRILRIRTGVAKKISFFLLFISLVGLPSLFSQQSKVTVIAKSASIYAESNEHSDEIERAKMGDVLTLFEPWRGEKEWLYVIYISKRWNGEITGFIKSSLVTRGEIIPVKLTERTAADAEIKAPEQKEHDKEVIRKEKKEKRRELPSLKDVFKPEIAKKVDPSEIAVRKTDVNNIEKALPPAGKTEESEAKINTEVEFTKDEVLPVSVKEKLEPESKQEAEAKSKFEPEIGFENESDSETESEPEPEIAPKQREIIQEKSEVLPFRDIVAPEVSVREPRAYAIIRTREEIPKLKIRTDEVKGVAEGELGQIEIRPYEIKTGGPEKEPETEAESVLKTETGVETETKTGIETDFVEESPPNEKKQEAIKKEVSEFPVIPMKQKGKEPIRKAKAIPAAEKTEDTSKSAEIKGEQLNLETRPARNISEKQEVPPIRQRKPPQEIIKSRVLQTKRFGLLAIGLGYGPSYGGFGASLQLNTKSGFSLHAGAGYYPVTYIYSDYGWLKNQILFSAGIKYYLPFKGDTARPYFDLQYGGLTVEAVQLPIGYYEGVPILENVQRNLYGVSFLGGLELHFGRIGAKGALGISYNTTEWEYWDRDLFLNGEFAIIVYF